MKRLITFAVLALAGYGLTLLLQEDEKPVTIDYKNSDFYTKEDMDEAIAIIRKHFSNWDGCKMLNIRYAGDECNSKENIKWMNELNPDKNYTQCIEFLTDYRSPKDATGTAWEPDTLYRDWQWYLARTTEGSWELVTNGY